MYCERCGYSGNTLDLLTHNCIIHLKSEIDRLKEFLNQKLGYDELVEN